MIFKVKMSDAVEKEMTEMELKKLVGDYIVSRAKDTGSITVPMVNAETATTKIVHIRTDKVA